MTVPARLNLEPARWIWLPSQRTLANTFVLFRREVTLIEKPRAATGWIAADSRYRLTVNGARVQWGPAPADPRHMEADPLDLAEYLRPGKNVLGVEVLYYGHGEGTWPFGKPGLLFLLQIMQADGSELTVVSHESADEERPPWLCRVDRAHPPGQFRRWYLRALQEEFDARLHPHGWDTPDYKPDESWLRPGRFGPAADRPPLAGNYPDYAGDARAADPDATTLRPRSIPLLEETIVPAGVPVESGIVMWHRDPDDWFENRIPGSFTATPKPCVKEVSDGVYEIPGTPSEREGVYLTFALTEQVVGWPRLTVDAPEGTIVELMVQEAHDPANGPWLDTHFFAWSRFICREGENRIEPFDFESFRWLQIHVRNTSRPVTVSGVGVRRRRFPWPNAAQVSCGEPALQRLLDATVNTLHNAAQETVVDGMGRERQQYSGDIGHALHPIRAVFGETRLPARFLTTYSHGLTLDGYFLDCWPAYDRLARLAQRQIEATPWGPLLDHGVGFAFDTWHHLQETGDLDAVREPYTALRRFADYLIGLRRAGGLLPVENIGVPTVWIDHDAYKKQRHKQCAFNLYAAAMFTQALAPLADMLGFPEHSSLYQTVGAELLNASVATFWDSERGLFVDNRPWRAEEADSRLSDRTLATALLYNQCPDGNTAASVAALVKPPPEMGVSYPANAVWRMRALGKAGRADVVLRELRERWATMRSVRENNTLAEHWDPRPDSTSEWSHCPIAPLIVWTEIIAGITPLSPGYTRISLRPQPADLPSFAVTTHTPRGPIAVCGERQTDGSHAIEVTLPSGIEAVWKPENENAEAVTLTGGQTHRLSLLPHL
jgi:alpha-L-rhamnosidase